MNEHYPFVNPPLPYAYDALEPYIDTQTMYLHHDRHLQRYVAELNTILRDYPELQNMSLPELISHPENLPEEVRQAIINYGGGVYNHILYFNGMTNSMNRSQAEALYPALIQSFGTLEEFFNEFKRKALSVFGSGFAWLVVAPDGSLQIVTTPNQNTPLTDGYCIVAGIDVWEHAYYLKRFNDRAAYIEDWFHVVNWEMADELYKQCMNAVETRETPAPVLPPEQAPVAGPGEVPAPETDSTVPIPITEPPVSPPLVTGPSMPLTPGIGPVGVTGPVVGPNGGIAPATGPAGATGPVTAPTGITAPPAGPTGPVTPGTGPITGQHRPQNQTRVRMRRQNYR